jgi:hypothetical protein
MIHVHVELKQIFVMYQSDVVPWFTKYFRVCSSDQAYLQYDSGFFHTSDMFRHMSKYASEKELQEEGRPSFFKKFGSSKVSIITKDGCIVRSSNSSPRNNYVYYYYMIERWWSRSYVNYIADNYYWRCQLNYYLPYIKESNQAAYRELKLRLSTLDQHAENENNRLISEVRTALVRMLLHLLHTLRKPKFIGHHVVCYLV